MGKESDGSWLEKKNELIALIFLVSSWSQREKLNFKKIYITFPKILIRPWRFGSGTETSASISVIWSWPGGTSVMPVVLVSLWVPLLWQGPDDSGLNRVKSLVLPHGEVWAEGDFGSGSQASLLSEILSRYHALAVVLNPIYILDSFGELKKKGGGKPPGLCSRL